MIKRFIKISGMVSMAACYKTGEKIIIENRFQIINR